MSPGNKRSFIAVFSVSATLLALQLLTPLPDQVKRYRALRTLSSVLNAYDTADSTYVIPAKDGRLFYREELRYLLLQWSKQKNENAVEKLSRDLARRNVALIVVPVPVPLEVYPEALTGIKVKVLSKQRQLFLRHLRKNGVMVLDLLPLFLKEKHRSNILLRADTHLAPAGNSVAALAIVREILRIVPELAGDPSRYSVRDSVIYNYEGDLAAKSPQGAHAWLDTIAAQPVLDRYGTPYSDTVSSEILLFGDSFAWKQREYGAHLSAHVARHIGKPVRLSSQLRASRAPRQIEGIVAADPAIRVVVWVFTARSLLDTIELPETF